MQVVKKLCVAGKHAATRGTGYKPLLSVAPHVFSQTIPNLEESVTACKSEMTMDTPYMLEKGKGIFKHVFNQSYHSTGRREPVVVVQETVAQRFQRDCPHDGRTTQDC